MKIGRLAYNNERIRGLNQRQEKYADGMVRGIGGVVLCQLGFLMARLSHSKTVETTTFVGTGISALTVAVAGIAGCGDYIATEIRNSVDDARVRRFTKLLEVRDCSISTTEGNTVETWIAFRADLPSPSDPER